MKKCLIISFFNSHNIGDRIIALSLANRYQKHFNVVKCSFEGTLNIWPEDKYNYGIKDDLKIIYGSCFTKLHKVFLKKKNKEIVLDDTIKREIENCDFLCIGGGNMLMYDYYRMFYSYVNYAKKCNKNVLAVDVGVGPFSSKEQLLNTCKCLDMCDSVTFRDKSSLELAKKHCISDKLFLAVDPCFLLDNKKTVYHENSFVAINILDFSLDFATKEMQKYMLEAYEALVKELAQVSAKKIVLFSTVYEDYRVIHKLAKRLSRNGINIEIRKVYTINDLNELYQNTCYVVAMRMHALILAYSFGIPHCGIAWQKKVESFFAITKHEENCFDVSQFKNQIQNIVSLFEKSQITGFPKIETAKEILDLGAVDSEIISEFIGEENAKM